MEKFKIGDKVIVNDPGLLMLQQFAPKGAKPNNVGIIESFLQEGDAVIEFPIDDNPEHTQVSIYEVSLLEHFKQKI